MDKQIHTGMILLVSQKAFDALDHGFLLGKMKYFGFRTSAIKWFEPYFSNRKLLVCIEAGPLKYSVPQSSMFGKLLFLLLHINDLPQSLSEAGSYLYADDTCVFYQHVKITENVLNKELSPLRKCQWFIGNKLLINFGEEKTKSILFSKARSLREINMSLASQSIKQHKRVE